MCGDRWCLRYSHCLSTSCIALEPQVIRRGQIRPDGGIDVRAARDVTTSSAAISSDGSVVPQFGESHVTNPLSDASMVVQTGESDMTDVSFDNSVVVHIGESYATNVPYDGSMVVQIGENDATNVFENRWLQSIYTYWHRKGFESGRYGKFRILFKRPQDGYIGPGLVLLTKVSSKRLCLCTKVRPVCREIRLHKRPARQIC